MRAASLTRVIFVSLFNEGSQVRVTHSEIDFPPAHLEWVSRGLPSLPESFLSSLEIKRIERIDPSVTAYKELLDIQSKAKWDEIAMNESKLMKLSGLASR